MIWLVVAVSMVLMGMTLTNGICQSESQWLTRGACSWCWQARLLDAGNTDLAQTGMQHTKLVQPTCSEAMEPNTQAHVSRYIHVLDTHILSF